jgi:hypothetical protein
VKLFEPNAAAVGVPLSTPVLLFNVRPTGNVPEVTPHACGNVPFVVASVVLKVTFTLQQPARVAGVIVNGTATTGVVPPPPLLPDPEPLPEPEPEPEPEPDPELEPPPELEDELPPPPQALIVTSQTIRIAIFIKISRLEARYTNNLPTRSAGWTTT